MICLDNNDVKHVFIHIMKGVMYKPLDYCVYLTIQLFSCKYVAIKLS